MERENYISKENKMYLLKTVGITTLIGGGIYFFYKKVKEIRQNTLSQWLEEYVKEAKIKLLNSKDNVINIETISFIFNLVTEIEEFLYYNENKNIEEKRLSAFSTKDYEDIVIECLEIHEQTLERAKQIVNKRLNIDIDELQSSLESYKDKPYLKQLIQTNRKPYRPEQLPKLSKDIVKQGFMHYSSQIILHDKIDKNNINLAKSKPELKDSTLQVYFVNKYILKDYLKFNYGIEEKYFIQLLDMHDLNQDTEVKERLDAIINI